MTSIQMTKFVGYPWSDLFNLVLDVKSYHGNSCPTAAQLDYCRTGATGRGITIIVSQMTVGFLAFWRSAIPIGQKQTRSSV